MSEIRTRMWRKIRKPLAALLALLVVAGGVGGYLWIAGGVPGWGRGTGAPARGAAGTYASSYDWIASYLRWDTAHAEGRVPQTTERLSKGGELHYVVVALNEWANATFEQWEVLGAVPWRGFIFLELIGEAREPEDGSPELWVVAFCWVQETGQYELVWVEVLDTQARYEARVGGEG